MREVLGGRGRAGNLGGSVDSWKGSVASHSMPTSAAPDHPKTREYVLVNGLETVEKSQDRDVPLMRRLDRLPGPITSDAANWYQSAYTQNGAQRSTFSGQEWWAGVINKLD
jgi:hypothetical protein